MSNRRARAGLLAEGPARVVLFTVILAGLTLWLQLTRDFPPPAPQPISLPWWALLGAFALLEVAYVHLYLGKEAHSFSLAEIPLIVGLAFSDPSVIILTRVAGAAIALAVQRQSPLKMSFNVVQTWTTSVVGAWLWTTVIAGGSPLGPRGWLAILVVAAVGDVLQAVSITAAISLMAGRPDLGSFRTVLVSGTLAAITNGSFAVLVITVLVADWRAGWALVAVGIVLFLAYRSYASLQRRHESLEQLADFTSSVGGELRAAAVGRQILTRVAELLRAEVVELTVSDDGELLRLLAREGDITSPDERTQTLAGRLAPHEGDTVLLPRGTRNARLRRQLDAAGLTDAVVVPLRGPRGVVGTLLAGNREGDVDTFDGEDVTVLEALANHATVALRNGRLADSLRREAAQREHEALHDPLTGLPNRRQFHDRLAWVLESGRPVAVLLLDLNRFKEINDTLGHQMGDRLLVEVGRRLRSTLPPRALVARLGGDEFAVAVGDVDDVEAAGTAEELQRALAEPIVLRELPIQVDASIGVALSPRDGHDPEGLLQRADVAMYVAKAAHTALEFYSSERDPYSPKRLALVAELRQAIETGALGVVYQPKVRLSDGVILGAEALVRWNHPRHGFVPPAEFIPIAEHTGLMRPLTTHVLRTALRQARLWRSEGFDLGMAVNLSARSLLDPTLVEDVVRLLREAGVSPRKLTLEITESDILEDPLHATAVLRRLEEHGIHRSVDDFGTGYSSLSYLNRLPVDEMKIDKSFVFGMTGDPDSAAIVGAVVDLGRRLGKRVVAEGVETEQHWYSLAALGCDIAQGFLLSRPLEGAHFAAWARGWRPPSSGTLLRPREQAATYDTSEAIQSR
jgi:diguanylate cyclase (GGDEF)-like protein